LSVSPSSTTCFNGVSKRAPHCIHSFGRFHKWWRRTKLSKLCPTNRSLLYYSITKMIASTFHLTLWIIFFKLTTHSMTTFNDSCEVHRSSTPSCPSTHRGCLMYVGLIPRSMSLHRRRAQGVIVALPSICQELVEPWDWKRVPHDRLCVLCRTGRC
jgi:hypothetical protein